MPLPYVKGINATFALKDVAGRYSMANQEYLRAFGLTEEDLPRLKTSDLHPPDRAEQVLAHDREVAETKTVVNQERQYTIDGDQRNYLVTKFPVTDSTGAVTGIGSLGTDVTDIKRTETQLMQSAKLATLGQMASGIAHELNQPLNIIRMAAESSLAHLEDDGLDAETWKSKLEKIENQAERMGKIIDHMRVFARQDTASADEIFSAADRVDSVLTLMKQQVSSTGIVLESDVPEGGGRVRGTPVQLEQVVMNLLSNARDAVAAQVDAASAAGNELEGRIVVAVEEDEANDTVTISVTDNGGGIPPDARKHIFDPFYTTKEEGDGTGLGLSISYKIVEGMGGRMEAFDIDGGTRFEVALPRIGEMPSADGDAPKPGAAEPPAGEQPLSASALTDEKPRPANDPSGRPAEAKKAAAGRKQCRVLVVDDEPMAAESLAEYLERKGYDVTTAGDGSEALESFGFHEPNVVITDLRMPVMDGYELIRRLREIHPDLPIVVTTGHTTVGDDDDVYPEGATYVIKKPISLREIVKHLENVTAAPDHLPARADY